MHHQLCGASFLLFYTIQYLKDTDVEFYLPMQHVELFNYENLTHKTVENLFLPSKR